MKQRYLFVFSLLLLHSVIFCQQNSIGLFAGINRSGFRISGNELLEETYSARYGMAVGGHFTYALNQRFGIRTEFIYQKLGACQQKNLRGTVDGTPVGLANYVFGEQYFEPAQMFKYCDDLRYLELPIMLQAQWGKRMKFHVHIGQSLSYQLNWKFDYGQDGTIENNYNRLSYSILAGLGVSFLVTEKIAIQLNGRATSNLTGFVEIPPDVEVKNRYFSGLLGIEYFMD